MDQDIQDVVVLIHRPLQIVILALNREHHFIHMPLIAGPWTAATQLIGILLAEFAAPLANGFIRNDDSALQEYFFDIAEAETEPKIQPYSMADDFHRKAVVFILRGARLCVHAVITSQQTTVSQPSQEVDNARAVPASVSARG